NKIVDDAIARATSATGLNPPDHDDVVTQLTFGFWCSLAGRRYTSLWPVLKRAFRRLAPGHTVHADLVEGFTQDLLGLRNTIAHHDPILDWDIARSVQNMKSIAGPISPSIQ